MTQSRRSFLKNAVFLPSAIYLTQCKTVGRGVGSSSFLKVSPTNSYLPKRVSWTSLSAADKQAFIEAVKKMKSTIIDVPETFGEGGARKLDQWAAQAEVHQWYCSHRTWNFLPWHRAYLYHFELFLRKYIRDDFRLPYWDWSKDQEIPQELQDPELLKTLNVSRDGKVIAFPGNPGDMETAEWWTAAAIEIGKGANYESIGGDTESDGTIENPYHNMVHVEIGGDMGQVPFAGKDPIFWLHHCNVDRLWSTWMDTIIDQSDKDPEKAKEVLRKMFPAQDVGAWLQESFPNHFWLPDGTLTSATVKSALFTEDLGYNYDTMKKTWTLSDIPADQPVAEVPAPVEKVDNTAAATTPATLRLATVPNSALTLQFTLPAAVYNGPQQLQSLRLKLSGIPEPADKSLRYGVSLVANGQTLALPEIVFFHGEHSSHKVGLIGVNLNRHMATLAALPEGKRQVQLVLTLRDKQRKAQAIPGLSTNVSAYKIKVKAVFK